MSTSPADDPGEGTDQGREWRVTSTCGGRRANEAEARAQLGAMRARRDTRRTPAIASDLIGKGRVLRPPRLGDEEADDCRTDHQGGRPCRARTSSPARDPLEPAGQGGAVTAW